ncbi:hypothetical protein LguiA_002197 [Lonicera macranthoides]
MTFPDPKHPKKSPFPFPNPPQFNLQQAFTNLQTHAQSALSNLQHNFLNLGLQLGPSRSCENRMGFARIAERKGPQSGPMPAEAIRERLAGVPVYALSNSEEEFVLITGETTRKSLGLFCFREEDAKVLLQHMKEMEPSMGEGSKVVAVALNKIFDLKIDGVAFRFIPEPTQIKHALEEQKRAGLSDYSFSGIPVFQSRSLVLKRQQKGYRPVFFRKEDLDKTLANASVNQNRLNPALREGDIQVGVLEDIIREMKCGSSTSNWQDVVFIPPGYEVSTDPSKPSVVPKYR